MYSINDQQIDYILNDIRRRGVEMEDLQYNLLDHICCIVEQNLESDGNFEDFYNKTIPKFFKHELWEIEEETINLLIFKNYYSMKKTMIISGGIAAFATVFGGLFKIMHWPGANALMLLGIVILSLVFLPIMFTLKIKEKQNKKDKLILGLGSIVAVLISLASLFKILHWPNATILVYMSFGLLLFLFLPLYFFSGIKNPETKVNTIVTSILIMAGTGLMLVLPNKQPSIRLSKATVNYMKNEDEALSQVKSLLVFDSTNNDVADAYSKLMGAADQLKDAIIKSIAGVEYKTYLKNDDNISPDWLMPAQLNGFSEREAFIEAALNFEEKAQVNIYKYESDLGYSAPNRKAEIDYVLSLQPHVKDLMSFIVNLQTQATLSLIRKKN